MPKTGNYVVSSWKNTKASTFAPNSLSRFGHRNLSTSNLPGPGHYEPKPSLNDKGEYFVSKFQSSSSRKFGRSQRVLMKTESNFPGPGTYRAPSEFGHYESNIRLKRRLDIKLLKKIQKSGASTVPNLKRSNELPLENKL